MVVSVTQTHDDVRKEDVVINHELINQREEHILDSTFQIAESINQFIDDVMK